MHIKDSILVGVSSGLLAGWCILVGQTIIQRISWLESIYVILISFIMGLVMIFVLNFIFSMFTK